MKILVFTHRYVNLLFIMSSSETMRHGNKVRQNVANNKIYWCELLSVFVGVCLFFIILVVFICGDLKHSNILINWEGDHQRFINVKIPRISFYDYTAYEEHLSIFRSIRLISPWSMPVLFGYFLWSTRHFSL